jgi:hypothetical protein
LLADALATPGAEMHQQSAEILAFLALPASGIEYVVVSPEGVGVVVEGVVAYGYIGL